MNKKQKITGKQLMINGSILLLLGVIGSNFNVIFSGRLGWIFMIIGVALLIMGIVKQRKEDRT